MKKNRFVFYFSVLLIISACSCNLLDSNSKEAQNARILSNPPFKVLTDSINLFPANSGLFLRRGDLLTHENYNHLAVDDYKKAWELKQDETTALAYTSGLFVSGKHEEAVRLLQLCLNKFPENTAFARRLSEAYLQGGKPEEALKQYNAIIKKDSFNFEAWYEKGVLLAQLKDTSGAILALETAYLLQPLQLFGISLANLYAETKNAKALALCDSLILRNRSQEDNDALFIKGVYYSNTNQPASALEQFETCIKNDWKFTDAYIEKGIILYKQKNIDEALKTFALAAKVSNTYADAYYWMGRCLETIGKKSEARDNYYRALALDRNFIEATEALKRLKE